MVRMSLDCASFLGGTVLYDTVKAHALNLLSIIYRSHARGILICFCAAFPNDGF